MRHFQKTVDFLKQVFTISGFIDVLLVKLFFFYDRIGFYRFFLTTGRTFPLVFFANLKSGCFLVQVSVHSPSYFQCICCVDPEEYPKYFSFLSFGLDLFEVVMFFFLAKTAF